MPQVPMLHAKPCPHMRTHFHIGMVIFTRAYSHVCIDSLTSHVHAQAVGHSARPLSYKWRCNNDLALDQYMHSLNGESDAHAAARSSPLGSL